MPKTKMFDDDIIDRMKDLMPMYLHQKGINPASSFRCLSPDHHDNSPSMRYSPKYKKVHCFSCGRSYDIFDLVGIDFSLKDWVEQVKKVADLFGIDIGNFERKPARDVIISTNLAFGRIKQELPTETKISYKSYDIAARIAYAHSCVGDTGYFKGRGFSESIIEKYQLGYWKNGYNDFVAPIAPELQYKISQQQHYTYFIPIMDEKGVPVNFIARMNEDGTPDAFNNKVMNMRGVQARFLNEHYLTNHDHADNMKTIFVVEGWADALSIEEVGGNAIALNSTSNVARFLRIVAENRKSFETTTFVAAGDYDKSGIEMNDNLCNGIPNLKLPGLNLLGLKNMAFSLAGFYNDPNDHITHDRAAFSKQVNGVMENKLGRYMPRFRKMSI